MVDKSLLDHIYSIPTPDLGHGMLPYEDRLVWYATLKLNKNPFHSSDIKFYLDNLDIKIDSRSIGLTLKRMAQCGYFKRERMWDSTAVYEYTPTWMHKALLIRYNRMCENLD